MIKKVHINKCPILDGYGVMGVFNSRTRPRVNRVQQLVCHVETRDALLARIMDAADVIRNRKCYVLLARFTTERQPVLRPAVAFSKTSFKHR